MKFVCSALFCFLLVGQGARAGDKLEAALYWGRNASPPLLARGAPPDLNDRLREVFGFRHYELMKMDRVDLHHPWTQWFIPRKDFFICLKPQRPQAGEPQLVDYEIYQEGFILARGKYEPNEGTPLFINGPDFKNGRLILVLEAR